MKRLTTIDIIVEWLRSRMGRTVGSYEIETALPKYSLLFHNHPVTPGTVNRKFRQLRGDREMQATYGIVLREHQQHGKESKWLVTPFTTTSSPLAHQNVATSSSPRENSEAA